MDPPVLPIPPTIWKTNQRPYFHTENSPINQLHRDLPWVLGNVAEIPDSKTTNTIAEGEGLEIGGVLGLGTYSAVHRGYWKPHRLNVAVKIYEKPQQHSYSQALPALKRVTAEVDALKALKHPNVIGFYGAMETKFRVYLILELVERGNLLQYLKNTGPLGESDLTRKWFRQLVSAMTYVHRKEIAHRDLKCENILLDMQLNIRVSDFGFALANLTWTEDTANDTWIKVDEFCGSLAYMSPEVIKKVPYCPLLSDVWSMGISLYGMIFAKFPYEEVNAQNILELPKNFKFPEGVKVSPLLDDLFRSIFRKESKRIRSYELLEKRWIHQENSIPLFAGRYGHLSTQAAEKVLKYSNQKIPEVVLEEIAAVK